MICSQRYLIKQTLLNQYATPLEHVQCWKGPQSLSAPEEEKMVNISIEYVFRSKIQMDKEFLG